MKWGRGGASQQPTGNEWRLQEKPKRSVSCASECNLQVRAVMPRDRVIVECEMHCTVRLGPRTYTDLNTAVLRCVGLSSLVAGRRTKRNRFVIAVISRLALILLVFGCAVCQCGLWQCGTGIPM